MSGSATHEANSRYIPMPWLAVSDESVPSGAGRGQNSTLVTCGDPNLIFSSGFERGDASEWSAVVGDP